MRRTYSKKQILEIDCFSTEKKKKKREMFSGRRSTTTVGPA